MEKRINGKKWSWVEELPEVLWVYKTMVKTPIGETPFALPYSSKAIIPVDMVMPTYKIQQYDKQTNEYTLKESLDLLDAKNEDAKKVANRKQMEQYFNSSVRNNWSFKVGDFLKDTGIRMIDKGNLSGRGPMF